MLDSQKILLQEAEILCGVSGAELKIGRKFHWNDAEYQIDSLDREGALVKRIASEVLPMDTHYPERDYIQGPPNLFSNPEIDKGTGTAKLFQEEDQSNGIGANDEKSLNEEGLIKWLSNKSGVEKSQIAEDYKHMSKASKKEIKKQYRNSAVDLENNSLHIMNSFYMPWLTPDQLKFLKQRGFKERNTPAGWMMKGPAIEAYQSKYQNSYSFPEMELNNLLCVSAVDTTDISPKTGEYNEDRRTVEKDSIFEDESVLPRPGGPITNKQPKEKEAIDHALYGSNENSIRLQILPQGFYTGETEEDVEKLVNLLGKKYFTETAYDYVLERAEKMGISLATPVMASYKRNSAALPGKLFDSSTVDSVVEKLKSLPFPYVKVYSSNLGGDEHVSILISISLDNPDTWRYNILQNSAYSTFYLYNNGVLKQIEGGHGGFPKIRKRTFSTVDQLINFLSQIKKVNPEKETIISSLDNPKEGDLVEDKSKPNYGIGQITKINDNSYLVKYKNKNVEYRFNEADVLINHGDSYGKPVVESKTTTKARVHEDESNIVKIAKGTIDFYKNVVAKSNTAWNEKNLIGYIKEDIAEETGMDYVSMTDTWVKSILSKAMSTNDTKGEKPVIKNRPKNFKTNRGPMDRMVPQEESEEITTEVKNPGMLKTSDSETIASSTQGEKVEKYTKKASLSPVVKIQNIDFNIVPQEQLVRSVSDPSLVIAFSDLSEDSLSRVSAIIEDTPELKNLEFMFNKQMENSAVDEGFFGGKELSNIEEEPHKFGDIVSLKYDDSVPRAIFLKNVDDSGENPDVLLWFEEAINESGSHILPVNPEEVIPLEEDEASAEELKIAEEDLAEFEQEELDPEKLVDNEVDNIIKQETFNEGKEETAAYKIASDIIKDVDFTEVARFISYEMKEDGYSGDPLPYVQANMDRVKSTIENELSKSKFNIYANNKLLVIKAGMDKIQKIIPKYSKNDKYISKENPELQDTFWEIVSDYKNNGITPTEEEVKIDVEDHASNFSEEEKKELVSVILEELKINNKHKNASTNNFEINWGS